MTAPPLATVAREWGRIGCIGFGGPPAHIALLRGLCVERRGWLERARLRGRRRRVQPAARAGLDAARDLLRVARCAARPARSSAVSASSCPGLVADPRALGAVPRLAADVGARRRRRARARRSRPSPCSAGWSLVPAELARARAAVARWIAYALAGGARRGDGRAVARARAARLRRGRARAAARARGRSSARPARGCGGDGRAARARLDGVQGRRALLRRRLRDRPADAGRRGRPLPLDDPTASSSTRSRSGRSRPGPVVTPSPSSATRAAGVGGGAARRARRVLAVVRVHPARRARASTGCARTARARAFLDGAGPGRDRRDPRLGDPARPRPVGPVAVRRPRRAPPSLLLVLRRGVVLTLLAAGAVGVIVALAGARLY